MTPLDIVTWWFFAATTYSGVWGYMNPGDDAIEKVQDAPGGMLLLALWLPVTILVWLGCTAYAMGAAARESGE